MTTKEELKVQVIGYAQELEELASGDYEEMAEYLEGVYDVKIAIDGNLRYDSVKIALAVWMYTKKVDTKIENSLYFMDTKGELS